MINWRVCKGCPSVLFSGLKEYCERTVRHDKYGDYTYDLILKMETPPRGCPRLFEHAIASTKHA